MNSNDGLCPLYWTSGNHLLLYKTAIGTTRNLGAFCHNGWSLWTTCAGTGTCGDYAGASRLELQYDGAEPSSTPGITFAASNPVRVLAGTRGLTFRDVRVGFGGNIEDFDGGTIGVQFTFPEDPYASEDLGTFTIQADPTKDGCNVVDGEFSYKKANGYAWDELFVISESEIAHTQVMFAHMTAAPKNGTPTTHTFPVLICVVSRTAKGNAGVFLSRTRSIPDVIQFANVTGQASFVRPIILATYDNMDTANAAYAEFATAFDDYVANCLDCGEDCGVDGWCDCVFERNGKFETICSSTNHDEWRLPQNCTTPTRWKLNCVNDGGSDGYVTLSCDGEEVARLRIDPDNDTSCTFTIPPCVTEYEWGGFGQSTDTFDLFLESVGDESEEEQEECTQAMRDAYDAIPKTQEEWDQHHNANALLEEMGE